MTKIIIQSLPFDVPNPYVPGHPCTIAEAKILNAVYHGRVRRAFTETVEKTMDDCGTASSITEARTRLQHELNEFTSTFSLNGPDPVQTEAINLAIMVVKRSIKGVGRNISDHSKASLREEAEKLLASPAGREITKLAKARVVEVQRLAAEELDRIRG